MAQRKKRAETTQVDHKRRHKLGQFDREPTLQQLDGKDWGEPKPEDTRLIRECLRLRRVQLKKLTVEDLRLLIGQEIGMDHLLPLALEILRQDPFAEGDCYAGDLLVNVLGVSAVFWRQNPDWEAEVASIGRRAVELCDGSPEIASNTNPKVIDQSVEDFLRKTQPSG
jgi:hypothetical protein